MKKIKLILFATVVFLIIGVSKVQALRIFKFDEGTYQCIISGGSNDLNVAYDTIQTASTCVTPVNVVIPSGVGQKTACEDFGGVWYQFGGNINYGTCKIINKTVCESKGGIFYPAVVTNDDIINITSDTTINYILIAYNNTINIDAKVLFLDYGTIGGTIGINGKIVINDNGKIEYSNKKLYGNSNDYVISPQNNSSVTYKSIMANGTAFPEGSYDGDAIPSFLNSSSTISEYFELNGGFKLNKPFTISNHTNDSKNHIVLKDNSTLDLLSNLTIDNGAKLTTGLNSKLLNSATLTVNGNLDIKGAFNNGYKLDYINTPTPTNIGTVTIGPSGRITLFGNAIGINNSVKDIPVTIDSGNPDDVPVESSIQGNGPRTITINSEITNGIVTSSKSSATSGEEIILTITPTDGYKIKSISVLDKFGEMPVTVTNNKFIMPGYNVIINVEFEENVNYIFTEGSNVNFSKYSKDDLKFRINAEYSLLDKVYVDNSILSEDDFTSMSGSTVIILKNNYLNTLEIKEHTLKVTFIDGKESTTKFKIVSEPNPQTGDNILNSLLLGSSSLIVLIGTIIFIKKKR